MNNQDAIAPDSRAWEMFDRFLTENAKELKLIAHWGDGDMGAMISLMRDRLEITQQQRQSSNARRELSAAKRALVMARDGLKCLCCGGLDQLRVDHVVPVSKGGTDDEDNLQTLCLWCNSRKGTKAIDYRKQVAA